MAGEYKAKIAVIGSDVSAQQAAQMQHIMVNNYTNAGLSILFLLVVYSIIFYGIRAYRKPRSLPEPSDCETPYLSIPKESVKVSSGHE